VQSGRWVLLFGRNIWASSSEMKAVITSEMLVLTYQMWCHYQEDNVKNVSNLLQQYNYILLYLKPTKEMEQNATPVDGLLDGTG
jgi:hypothetical protein